MLESVQHHTAVEKCLAGKKQKLCYPYGNYPHYYSYRLEDFDGKDPRIQVECSPEGFIFGDWMT